MTTKTDFFQNRLPSQANALRDDMDVLEKASIGLQNKDKATLLDYIATLDRIEAVMRHTETQDGPDFRPEIGVLETVEKRFFKQAPTILRTIGGPTALKAARPSDATMENQPWWFIDTYVSEQRALQTKQWLRLGGVLAGILLVLIILFNTVLKPDPIIVESRARYEDGLNILLLEADYEASLAQAEAALAIRPEDLESLILKGQTLLFLGRDREAQDAFNIAGSIAPRPEYVPLGRGQLMLRLNRAADALALSEEAIAINEEFAEGWFMAGQAHQQLGDMQAAFETMNKASDLAFEQNNDALYAIIRVNLGYLTSPGGGGGF